MNFKSLFDDDKDLPSLFENETNKEEIFSKTNRIGKIKNILSFKDKPRYLIVDVNGKNLRIKYQTELHDHLNIGDDIEIEN